MKVGFIGLGEQGEPLAINVVRAGFDLMAYDLRREPVERLASEGARVSLSARELGAYADLVEIVVVNDEQVEAVVLGEDGVLQAVRSGTVIAIHSTIRPATVKRIGEIASRKGVELLDAPVSGGRQGAERRAMCYMVGGASDALTRCRGVFATSASTIVHMGVLGSGMAAKLAHQVILCLNLLAADEGAELARCLGLDQNALGEAVHAGAAQSRIADRWLGSRPVVQAGALFDKDLALALELADEQGLELKGAAFVRERLREILKTPAERR